MSNNALEVLPVVCGGVRVAIPRKRVLSWKSFTGLQPEGDGHRRIRVGEDRIEVVDLARALGQTAAARACDVFLTRDNGGTLRAYLVDRVEASAMGRAYRVPEILGQSPSICASAIVHIGTGYLALLDLDQVDSKPAEIVVPAMAPYRVPTVQSGGASAETSRIVLFSVGQSERRTRACLALEQVPEVRDETPVTWIPGAPPWIRGLALWQNRFILALDFGRLSGLGPTPDERQLVVRGFSDEEFYLVSTYRDVTVTSARNARDAAALPEWATPWAFGAYQIEQTAFAFLDVAAISHHCAAR